MNISQNTNKKQKLFDYIQLISLFLNNEIDPSIYEKKFFEMFKNDSTMWEEVEFNALNQLFTDLDMFCSDSSLRNELDIDENQLREQSRIASQKLLSLTQR